MHINGAFLHLLMNHIPVLLPIVGAVILAVGALLNLKQTMAVGIILIALGALAAIPTYLTGDAARQIAQNYPTVDSASIDKHAEAALYSLFAIELVGALALLLLWQARGIKGISRQSCWALVVLTVIAALLVGRAAHLGGLIRHEEIEQGISAAQARLW